MNIIYRLFDITSERKEKLFDLFKATYGNASHYEDRWNWEITKNPFKAELKIFIAESNRAVVGATTRFPIKLKVGDKIIQGAFSGNSMVHPEFRRKGVMEKLYQESAKLFPILYSKGTMPGMYKLLMKMGYQSIHPNTYMTSILSGFRWLLWRIKVYKPKINMDRMNFSNDEFSEFHKFDDSFNDFWREASVDLNYIILKDSTYMNWRYVEIPHRQYRMLYRIKDNKIISMSVVRCEGTTVKLVDILWNKSDPREPGYTISYIMKILKKSGFLKLICWGTHMDLRNTLKKNRFIDNGETSRFSFFSKTEPATKYTIGDRYHFVDGDGDSEYL